MSPRVLDELKQQIPLLEYLQSRAWRPVRALRGGRWLGLCPLHTDHKPSFLIDPQNSLFYCYGCGRGKQALTLLRAWCGVTPREKLADFAKRASCADTNPISPHRLRHTWGTDMLRCGLGNTISPGVRNAQ